MKRIITILLTIILIGSLQGLSYAQKSASSRWETSIGEIRGEINNLIKENDRLNNQYSAYRKELLKLQTHINKVKLDNRALIKDSKRVRKLTREQVYRQDKLRAKGEKFKNEISVNKAKVAALNDELADLNEAVKLWDLQIADLKLQRKELLMELKSQEDKRKDIEEGEAGIVKDLRGRLSKIQKEEADVTNNIKKLEGQKQDLAREIEKYEDENRDLERQIRDLEQQKRERERANVRLKKDNKSTKRSLKAEYLKRVSRKRSLEAKAKNLEAKLDRIKKSIEESLGIQEEKRSLVNEIIRLDEENKNLRNQISALQQKITAIKKETTSAGAER